MPPTKTSEADPAAPREEPSAPARTPGKTFLARLSGLPFRIATRAGLEPAEVKGAIVLVVVAAVVVAVVVPLSVFAQGAAPVAVPSATASAPATPPRQTSVAPDEAPPEDPCESFLDTGALATALGGSADVQVQPSELLLSAVGGFDCWYLFGELLAGADGYTGPKDSAYVYVTAAPSAIADPEALAASLSPVHCAPEPLIQTRWSTECSATVAIDGWWYSLTVDSFSSVSALRTSFDAITELLEGSLGSSAAPDQANVVEPFDCDSVEISGAPGISLPREYPISGEIAMAASLLAAPATCRFTLPDDEFWDLRVYPGGAAAYDRCTHNNWRGLSGKPISVPGVNSVFAFSPQPDDLGTEVCATDGKSTVNLWRSLPYSASDAEYRWDDELLDALGSFLVPVFAAAAPVTSPFIARAPSATPLPVVSPVIDGGCPGLLDPTTLALVTVGEYEGSVVSLHPLLATVGGINCEYRSYDATGWRGGIVSISVAPSSIVGARVLRASLVPAHCATDAAGDTTQTCSAVVEVNGWWYSILLGGVASAPELQKTFAAVTASLERRLTADEAPPRSAVTAPFDCDGADITGLPVARWRQVENWHRFRWPQPVGDPTSIFDAVSPVSAAAFLLAGPVTCQYTMTTGEPWQVTVYPGSASAYDQCVELGDQPGIVGATISVAGVKSVFLQPHLNDFATICATDGISTVEVTRPLPWDYIEYRDVWPEADLTTLSELLVPIFAAAD